MYRKRIILTLMIFTMLFASALPAFAISSISNSLAISDYSVNTGQSVNFSAKTVFSYNLMPNPYSSNFVTEINAYHFNRPSTYQSAGLINPNGWVYSNPGIFTSPTYRYYSGKLWIAPTDTKYLRFSSTAKSAATGSRRSHRQGQSTELDWGISYGSPAWVTTTHN